MTKELLQQLSTGDKVKNTKTGREGMVTVMAKGDDYTLTIEQLIPLEDWELTKSRTTITKQELEAIAKYHEDMADKQKKNKTP